MANRHMKRCSTSLIIKDMEIKTAMSHYLTVVRTAIIKNTKNNNLSLERIQRKGNPHALFVGI